MRKVLEGVVVSNKMNKTVVVKATSYKPHPRYKKLIECCKKFYAHDEKNEIEEGQTVMIQEVRPLSKLKCWKVVEVINS